ncbi:MAG: ATP--guanido phosphotransferase [Planctomycetota bacterium]
MIPVERTPGGHGGGQGGGSGGDADAFDWGHADWLRTDAPENDVVLSSRVRLARNLDGHPFALRADPQDKALVLDIVRAALARAGRLADLSGPFGDADLAARTTAPRRGNSPVGPRLTEPMVWLDLHRLDRPTRDLLVERHQISKLMAKGDTPRAAAVSVPSERLSVMVNEEDHVRVQSLRAGFSLGDAMQAANDIDDAIEQTVTYAFSPRWGYLTACPTNLGTGIRVSVMVHLPALRMRGDIEKVKRAATDMSLAVRGFWGEGSEAEGDFFQLSNQTTLGKPERVILEEFEREIMPAVIDYERRAREQLVTKQRDTLLDDARRAAGLLASANLLGTGEAMSLLSRVRIGLVSGVLEPPDHLPGLTLDTVHELMLLVHTAHLSKKVGRPLEVGERKRARSQLVRDRLHGTPRHTGRQTGL